MARETKVGLLAGLAFILCFAIILANRGRQEAVTTHLPYQVDRNVAQDALAVMATSGAEVVLPDREAPASESSSHGPLARSVPQRTTPKPPSKKTGEVVLSQRAEGRQEGQRSLTSPLQERVERRRALQEYLDATRSHPAEEEPPGRDATVREQHRNAEQRPTSTAASEQGQHTLQQSQLEPASRAVRRNGPARHTIVRGDTLSRIATVHYGSRSTAVINALFDANRSVLSSPDLLPLGAQLILPVIDRYGGPSSGKPTRMADTPKPIRPPSQDTNPNRTRFRWYQIKKNDRYVSIARRQLGSASRWREIYELNKDKFPDPQRIREGVRIKLPAASVQRTPVGQTVRVAGRNAGKPMLHAGGGARP